MTRYLVYDVFTDAPFGGNPLAVIPDATALPEPQLQRIAREFNFSETTFVYPAADADHTARVRIFTPRSEVPFAGHPTIGTAVALADLGYGADMVLELGVGPLPCTVTHGAAVFTTRVPLQRLAEPAPADIAACLSLERAEIVGTPVMASVGLPFVLAELATQEALARCAPRAEAFADCAGRYPSDLDFAIYAFTRSGNTVRARMFAPLDGVPEDPATGSAAASLCAHLAEAEGGRLSLDISQGAEMGRRSRIWVSAAEGAVTVEGRAVRVMDGRLTL